MRQCYVKMSIEEINLVVLSSSWDNMSVSLTRNKFSMYLFAIVFILKDLQKVEENRVKWENNAPKLPQKISDAVQNISTIY